MDDVIREEHPLPQLKDPVLIAAFAVRQRAGRLAHTALSHLVEEWGADHVATIASEQFLDFIVRRPQVRRTDDVPVIDWPDTKLYVARPEGAERDFLLLLGYEPNFYWHAFIDALSSYAAAAGVRTVVNIRSFPASVPHTRSAPVLITSSDIELELQFGVQASASKEDGPADLGAVVTAAMQAKGCQIVDLSLLQPFYYPRISNAQATIALAKTLDNAFGGKTGLEALEAAAAEQATAVEESLADTKGAAQMIRELEQTYDEGLERFEFLAPGVQPSGGGTSRSLPTGEELIQDVERFLREGGPTGGAEA